MASVLSPADPNLIDKAGVLLSAGDSAGAAVLLRPLLESGRAGLLARLLFARALSQSNGAQEGLVIARETALLFPDAAAAALGLGEILLVHGQLPTAIAEFQRALRIDPDSTDARLLLGKAWLEAGEPEKALRAFAAVPPENQPPGLSDLIKEAERMHGAPRSNARYVRHLFDQFSADYDARMLGQLGYSAPSILRELAGLVVPTAREHSLDILDLGCGTGLAGSAFADLARRLDGIDLSPAMVEKARRRGLYANLIVGDIETVPLRQSCDLVIAADTLVYLGDLATLFASIRNALRPGGHFLFTVEKQEEGLFALGPKRRWRHSESYLRNLAETSAFETCGALACTPRSEGGIPVEGLAVALRKPL